jgi:hypothetical protein
MCSISTFKKVPLKIILVGTASQPPSPQKGECGSICGFWQVIIYKSENHEEVLDNI